MQYTINVEHHIQRDILQRLTNGRLRFSNLKPDGLESNIFTYHLASLRKMGFIEKTGDNYHLTSAGLTYIDRLSSANFKLRHQPKTIAVLVVKNALGQIAILQRKTEPYLSRCMLPSGKIHFGETLQSHAGRELLEKTGLQAPLTYCGLASILISRQDQVVTQALAIVWRAQLTNVPNLHTNDPRFEALWSHATDNLMPGTAELITHATGASQPFMLDLQLEDS
jgi:ADP-ribose pyrophosphatase YjhB (NUDIX family)